MCLAINLEIKSNECYYVSKRGFNYDHLYNEQNKFNDKLNRKVFRQLDV